MESSNISKWISKAYSRSYQVKLDSTSQSPDKVEEELNSIKALISKIMNHEAYINYDFSQHQSQLNGISENLASAEHNLKSRNQSWWKRIISTILDTIGIFLGLNSLGQKLLGTAD